MSVEKMFELATRKKYRFSYKGLINVEDLWELSVQSLDAIFKDLNSQLKQSAEESLLQVKTAADKETEVKIEIIKYIVKTKQDEAEARLKAKENKEKKQKIQEILAAKQDQDLQNKSPEDLQKMLEELE